MNPKDFVGAIISLHDEENKSRDWVLLEFLGEGNSRIAYRIAPLSNPTTEMRVAKFPKSDVRFQMTVLHSSFRIAEGLFPEHPQRVAPDERMRRLTGEMLMRIASCGAAVRVKAYRSLLVAAEQLLTKMFYERFKAGTLPVGFLDEFDALTFLIDENLVEEIETSLAESLTTERRLFFEHCLGSIKKKIETLKLRNTFRPLLQNSLVKLLGLHLEGFIDFRELLAITRTEVVQGLYTANDFAEFVYLIGFLYNRAAWAKENSTFASKADSTKSAYLREYQILLEATTLAAIYLDESAVQYSPSLSYLSGKAKSWLARVNILTDQQSRAITLFEEALQLLTTDESQPERYDTLVDLARLLSKSDQDRAYTYAREALAIKATMGY
jgi:hypothetical protein